MNHDSLNIFIVYCSLLYRSIWKLLISSNINVNFILLSFLWYSIQAFLTFKLVYCFVAFYSITRTSFTSMFLNIFLTISQFITFNLLLFVTFPCTQLFTRLNLWFLERNLFRIFFFHSYFHRIILLYWLKLFLISIWFHHRLFSTFLLEFVYFLFFYMIKHRL